MAGNGRRVGLMWVLVSGAVRILYDSHFVS